MSKFDKALSETFSVTPLVIETTPKQDVVVYESRESDSIEFDEVTETLNRIITKAEDALEDISDIAKAEESPRAFEVLNAMLNTISDISMKIIEVEERKEKLKTLKNKNKTDSPPETNNVVNNTTNNVMFVGTTEQLQDEIQRRLKE